VGALSKLTELESRPLRILVTGGSGFIGTNAVEALLRHGHTVMNIDIASPKDPTQASCWRQVDILDLPALRRESNSFRPEVVLHLAARASLDEKGGLAAFAANIDGVANMIEAIIAAGSVERSFFTSTRLVNDLGYVPTHDRDYKASTMYGLSKARGEELVRDASPALGTWTILRPTGIWGPWFGVPYRDFFKTIERGLYVHPGRRTVRKAYGYVENTIYEIERLLTQPAADVHGQTYVLTDYPAVSVREWAELIREKLGARRIRSVPVPALRAAGVLGDVMERIAGHAPLTSFRVNNMVTDMLYDTAPLEALVGRLPFSVEEGVDRTITWLKTAGA
jgi:nucleoside-diphosphate-sugar epimerase